LLHSLPTLSDLDFPCICAASKTCLRVYHYEIHDMDPHTNIMWNVNKICFQHIVETKVTILEISFITRSFVQYGCTLKI
jgi:hypothetical protein